jgi:uncharacterized protein (TIGR00730 family)
MKKICVFCGSSTGRKPLYVEQARALGADMAKKDIGLVYGGASIGVMGAIADSCLEAGGKVWGVIPKSIIDLEVGHQNLTGLEVVEDMHQRKARMYELSDAFFALPGGMGTLDELCEIITWAQLRYHSKPCYIINTDGFFDGLLQHFAFINKEGFLSDAHFKLFKSFDTYEEALSDFSHL